MAELKTPRQFDAKIRALKKELTQLKRAKNAVLKAERAVNKIKSGKRKARRKKK